MVSKGLYQQMGNETLGSDRIHLGPYRWDPLHAHFLDQWVPEGYDEQAQEEGGEEKPESGGWKVNFNG